MSSESVCEIVRKQELEYTRGSAQVSKYVSFDMYDTICRIEAYLNSQHVSGSVDSLGREKPFFNIVVADTNIWMRATDIDRSHIRIRGTKSKDWLDSFLATIHLQAWMRKENFGAFLNEWGRTLARYGSAITKFIKNTSGLHFSVKAWNMFICDPVDFESNPKIEILELTEAELYERVNTHGYNLEAVKGLVNAITERETVDKQRKDKRTGFIRLYELHATLSRATLAKEKGETPEDGDENRYVPQMHVISFVGKRNRRKTEYEDFSLFAGEEDKDPYRLDHLIKEDGRSLAIGAVEHLFDVQWMTNHAIKTEKDTLDIASRLIFQTADANYLNMNVLDNIESGDILIHGLNMPLTQINTGKYDITSMMNFRQSWRQLGHEINGISEAMLGIHPKSGEAWRQTEAVLAESYSLFELMTENKGLAIEEMLREEILPYIKENLLDTADEVSAMLEAHDIARIDSVFLKNEAIKKTNRDIMTGIEHNLDRLARGEKVEPIDVSGMFARNSQGLRDSMAMLGSERFFKPSELSDKMWQEQFKNLEWEAEVDITGEGTDIKDALQTLNTALKLIMTPGFAENKKAQAIVGRILELAGAMSPIEYAAIPNDASSPPTRNIPAFQETSLQS